MHTLSSRPGTAHSGAATAHGGLQIRGVAKTFGEDTPVLREIDLEVAAGQLVSLVGASGTGKSTLLRIVAGLDQADAGRITYGGSPLTAGDVGFVFQRPILYPHLSVRDNILFPTRLRGYRLKADTAYYRELLDALSIGELQKRKPHELSGGQAQRVGIARALIRKAPVVLFDEPLASVDEQLSASIRTDIARLHAEYGFTGLYVTHDQNEALQLGQKVAVMDGGYLVQVDTPAQLLANPHTLQVARLSASPALNKLVVRATGVGLPQGVELYVRATSLYRVGEGAAQEQQLPVRVLSALPQVGGVLYRVQMVADAPVRVAFGGDEAGLELVVLADQSFEYFEADSCGEPPLGDGQRAVLSVPGTRCFLFAHGQRVYG